MIWVKCGIFSIWNESNTVSFRQGSMSHTSMFSIIRRGTTEFHQATINWLDQEWIFSALCRDNPQVFIVVPQAPGSFKYPPGFSPLSLDSPFMTSSLRLQMAHLVAVLIYYSLLLEKLYDTSSTCVFKHIISNYPSCLEIFLHNDLNRGYHWAEMNNVDRISTIGEPCTHCVWQLRVLISMLWRLW